MSEVIVAVVGAGSVMVGSLLTAKVSGDKLRSEERSLRRQERAELETRFREREERLWANAEATMKRQQADIERTRQAHGQAVSELRKIQNGYLELKASNGKLQNTVIEQQKQIVRLEADNERLRRRVIQTQVELAQTRSDVDKLRDDLQAAIELWGRPQMPQFIEQKKGEHA